MERGLKKCYNAITWSMDQRVLRFTGALKKLFEAQDTIPLPVPDDAERGKCLESVSLCCVIMWSARGTYSRHILRRLWFSPANTWAYTCTDRPSVNSHYLNTICLSWYIHLLANENCNFPTLWTKLGIMSWNYSNIKKKCIIRTDNMGDAVWSWTLF